MASSRGVILRKRAKRSERRQWQADYGLAGSRNLRNATED